ncbi:hypothetical protein LDENG_00110630 [Lucifuga dentata]|nr:hypothetical protein LDENG_00110630 [Lucifuga dentata]
MFLVCLAQLISGTNTSSFVPLRSPTVFSCRLTQRNTQPFGGIHNFSLLWTSASQRPLIVGLEVGPRGSRHHCVQRLECQR